MKKIDLKRLTWLLAGVLVSLTANANNKDYYSKATATAVPSAAGKVYVAYNKTATTSNSTSAESGKDSQSSAPTHTYYFLAQTTDNGYTFTGWYDAQSGGNKKSGDASYSESVTAAESVGNATINRYARWSANQYSVSFDTQTEDVANPTSQTVTYASTYGTLPAPTRRFYAFGGWFTGATDGSQVTADTKVTTASNHTLYAHWTLMPEDQTISWGSAMQFNMAKGTRQPIAVSATSELPAFTYESDNEAVISIDGEYLQANATGEANITVRQAGNEFFNAASLTTKFTVWSKETPVFAENGFSADETCELKVGQQVTISLANVSDGLNGEFTVTASESGVMGISREGNTLTFSADQAGTTTITVAQAENDDIFALSKTYTFHVTRYVPAFSLDKTELELEQTAQLTLSNTDGASIIFAPEGIVSYDGSTGTITAIAPGTTTLTVTQAETDAIEAKSAEYTITVSKKTPTLIVKMNGTERTSMSVEQGSSPISIAFDKVSDAEVAVTNVSGAQYASYVDGKLTPGAVGTAKYRATLAETDTYQGTSVDFSLTVTSNSSHLPISGKSYTIGSGSATNWTHKYETMHFVGIPDKLSFSYKYIYQVQGNIGNPSLTIKGNTFEWMFSSLSDEEKGVGNVHMLYIEESADGNSWTTIWTDDQATDMDTHSSGEIQLEKTTRYLRFHHSCNFSNSYTNIQVTELKKLDAPEPSSIDFGSAVINSGEVSKTATIEWCNIAPLSVTSSNPHFTATPAQFGNYEQFGTQELTIRYAHTSEAGTNEGDITISNGTQTRTIHVRAVTTKRPQTITWNSDLAATGFAMNVGEQYPDEVYVPVLATATNGERITYTSDNTDVVEVVADTALLAKAIGTANITAYQGGDAEYQEVSDTRTFQVTNKQKQSIQWDQNLYGLLTTSGEVELTATATSGGEITYTSANESIVKVNGNVLTVVGEGETYITATQAGFTDANEVEWLSVSQDKNVIVRNPASQCQDMALPAGTSTSLTLNGSNRQKDYSLVGVPQTLTFSAKHGTKTTSSWVEATYSSLIVEQYAQKNGEWGWYREFDQVVGTTTASYSVALDPTATKMRIRTLETGTDHTITNINVTRKKFMSADVASVDRDVECNAMWQQIITVSHSNIDVITLSSKQGLISLSTSTLGEGCGSYGDDAFTASFTPLQKYVEYKDTIVITDGKAQPSTILIPVRLYSKGLNQSISGFELPATAKTTDEIAVSASASSELEVSFTSSDDTIAYVENGHLVILRDGTVTITATQAGNDKYDAAPSVARTIVISKAATSITTAPTAGTITYGQTLGEATLSGGQGSVEGTFAWETPEAKPAAGTPSYNVVFTPAESGIYATATTLVSLRVERATPTISTWPTAGEITIAQSVGESVLTGGETDTEGTFAWKNPTENRLHPGSYERTVVFTPADADNFIPVEQKISLTVVNVLARITELPVAVVDNAVYGITLADVTLQGGAASVAGSFAWQTPATKPQAGTHSYSVVFTPEDLEFYSPVQLEVSLSVEKATPAISTWPQAGDLTYGQALSASQLTGGEVDVEGAFGWADGTQQLAVGSYTLDIVFTPADTVNYISLGSQATVNVLKATAAYTAPTAISSLNYTGEAQALVNAGSTEDGGLYYRLGATGAWEPTVPAAVNAGRYEIWYQVIGDANHNNTEVLGPVTVDVAKIYSLLETEPIASTITFGQTLGESVLTGGEANVPGTFAWLFPETLPEAGTDEYEVVFTPDDSVNYEQSLTLVALTVEMPAIIPEEPEITHLPEPTAIYYTHPLSESQLLNAAAAVEGTFAWAKPDTILPVGTHAMNVVFTPEDMVYYLPTTFAVDITVMALPTTYGADTLNICSGTSVVYNGKTYKRNTKENVLLNEKNQYGGDSIVALVVKVIPVMKTKANKTIVEGSQETWQDIDLSLIPAGDTTLTVTYTSVYGCDSIFILNLTVTPRIATGMEDAEQVEEAGYRKMFYNGHIYIRKGDAWYDLMGKRLQ